jgi:hypothetical protein
MKKRITIVLDSDLLERLHQVQSNTILKTNSSVSISSIISQMVTDGVSKKHAEMPRVTSKTIEKILMNLGKKTAQDIGAKLYKKHHVYFADYWKDPAPLIDILKSEFGPAHEALIKKIDASLKDNI